MGFEIRQAMHSDCKEIGRFLENGFPNTYRYPERWTWLNKENPFISKSLYIPSVIAISENTIVGHHGSMQIQTKVLDHSFYC